MSEMRDHTYYVMKIQTTNESTSSKTRKHKENSGQMKAENKDKHMWL